MKLRLTLASIALAAAAVLGTSAAQATVVFTNNFDSEHGGTTALNYTGFSNFLVTSGKVDLVSNTNNFGITCAGNSGSCVDLVGTPGSGVMQTSVVAFTAGQTVTLSFDLAQDQRDQLANNVFANINFTSAVDLLSSSFGGAFGSSSGPTGSQPSFGTTTVVTDPAYNLYTISFVADQAGSFTAQIGTTDKGFIGALLDNVTIDVSAIPEPDSWMMLLVGFFGIGAMVRYVGGKNSAASAV